MGYVGAFTGDMVTGHVVHHYGWQPGVFCWAGFAFAGAIAVAWLWNVKPREIDAKQENGS
jgi:sugar phosphate permease